MFGDAINQSVAGNIPMTGIYNILGFNSQVISLSTFDVYIKYVFNYLNKLVANCKIGI